MIAQGLASTTQSFNAQQQTVWSHLTRCRSEQAGYDRYACERCGYQSEQVRSCHDRHCPCCQQGAIVRWCHARRADVLPLRYFHLVFTLPHGLNGWISCHAAVIYRLLFESSWRN